MGFWGELGVLGIIISTSIFISKNLVNMYTKNIREDNEDNKLKIEKVELAIENEFKDLIKEFKLLNKTLNETVINFTEKDYKRQKDIVKLDGLLEVCNKRISTLEREIKALKK